MTASQASPSPTRGASRVCRGVVLAVTSAALAVVAHAMAGGALPDAGLTILLTVGVAAVGVALADRRRRTTAILAVLGTAQLATHVLLSIDTTADTMAMPTHVDGPAMLAAHTVAVLGSAAMLAKADAAIFLFAGVLAMLLPRVLVAPPVSGSVVVVRARSLAQDTATSVLLRRSHARRGPPVSA